MVRCLPRNRRVVVEGISISLGSYAQAQTNYAHDGGSVTFGTDALEANDTLSAILDAPNPGANASIILNLGTNYGGHLTLRGYSAVGNTSTIDIETSETGASGSFKPFETITLPPTSLMWVSINASDFSTFANINNAKYIEITVMYGGGPSYLYLDAIYVI
jgi:hypothetical protein